MKTALSSCRSAWSRSRRRRGRRPHEVFGFASNVLIIDGELRKTFGQCSTLKRASRSLAKTGFGRFWRALESPLGSPFGLVGGAVELLGHLLGPTWNQKPQDVGLKSDLGSSRGGQGVSMGRFGEHVHHLLCAI